MIRVTVWREGEGAIRGFRVEGHAGFAAHGQDIVCAAVSALALTAILGLEKYISQPPETSLAEDVLTCRLPRGLTPAEQERAGVILETMNLGLAAAAANYAGYIQLETGRLSP